jgi:hypothetical protein
VGWYQGCRWYGVGNRTVRVVGGVLWAGTKGVNGMVWVSRAVRGGGWCVVGWYQGCKWYGVGKQSGEGWWVVCCGLVPRV